MPTKYNLVTYGNSIANGYQSTSGNGWLTAAGAVLGGTYYDYRKVAQNGYLTQQMLSDYNNTGSAMCVTCVFDPTYTGNIVIPYEYVNSMTGQAGTQAQSAASEYSLMSQVWSNLRAAGFLIGATTMIPDPAASWVDVDGLNNLILSDPSRYDFIIRFDQIQNKTYADGTHPDDAMYDKMGTVIGNAVQQYTGFPATVPTTTLAPTTTTTTIPLSTTTTTVPVSTTTTLPPVISLRGRNILFSVQGGTITTTTSTTVASGPTQFPYQSFPIIF